VTSRCGSSDIGAIVLIEEEDEENGKKEDILVKGALLYTKGKGY
jgi:hypothetical protein